MSFHLVHNDLTKMKVDAIVNAANTHLEMGGGVCGAIFQGAGVVEMRKACFALGKCEVGEAVITDGFKLPAKHVIHAVGPIWHGGKQEEASLLAKAYHSSLQLAVDHKLTSIAFPLISSGIYGYPKREALEIARETIKTFLQRNEINVYVVLFDREAVELSHELEEDILHFIDTYYEEDIRVRQEVYADKMLEETVKSLMDFDEMEIELEETFSQRLFHLIDEKGRKDVDVYKGANVDRKLFSKIRSNIDYQPKKETVLALAISLQLSIDETEDLLERAGYALSMSHLFDVIVRYFLEKRNYDLFSINEALFKFNQKLLGA